MFTLYIGSGGEQRRQGRGCMYSTVQLFSLRHQSTRQSFRSSPSAVLGQTGRSHFIDCTYLDLRVLKYNQFVQFSLQMAYVCRKTMQEMLRTAVLLSVKL